MLSWNRKNPKTNISSQYRKTNRTIKKIFDLRSGCWDMDRKRSAIFGQTCSAYIFWNARTFGWYNHVHVHEIFLVNICWIFSWNMHLLFSNYLFTIQWLIIFTLTPPKPCSTPSPLQKVLNKFLLNVQDCSWDSLKVKSILIEIFVHKMLTENLFSTWLGQDQDYLGESPEWLYRYLLIL